MRTIRILHLSDLLIGAEDAYADPGQLAGLLSEAFQEGGVDHRVDYLVACGNLTSDGTPENFRLAQLLLQKLCKRLLVTEDNPAATANRVIIVPGRNDIRLDAEGNLHPELFRQFYTEFYRELVGAAPPLPLEKPLVRQLKDLSYVAVSYWNCPAPADARQCERLQEALGGIEPELLQLNYCHGTPTILISSESPLLSWTSRARFSSGRVREFVEKTLKLDLHLFGAGPVVCIPFEPFIFRHIGLSTGPRVQGSAWPLRFNLIELPQPNPVRRIMPAGPAAEMSSLRVKTFQKTELRARLNDHLTEIGVIDRVLNRHESHLLSHCYSHRPLLLHLLQLGQDNPAGSVRFDCFPGTGIDGLSEEQVRTSLGQEVPKVDVAFATVDWEGVKFELNSYLPKLKRRAKDAFKKLKTDLGLPSSMRPGPRNLAEDAGRIKVAILYDRAVQRLPDHLTDWLETIVGHAEIFINYRVFFAYIHQPSDSQDTIERYFRRGSLVPDLDQASFSDLIRSYDRTVPVTQRTIENLTWRHLGFGKELLGHLEDIFHGRWSGAEAITRKTPDRLLGEALATRRSWVTSERFRDALESLQGGKVLYWYLHKKLRDRHAALIRGNASGDSALDEDAAESFTLNEVVAAGADPEDIEDLLATLEAQHIVKETIKGRGTYKLLSVLPFLALKPDFADAKKASSVRKVFISFGKRWQRELDSMLAPLKRLAVAECTMIEEFVYTAKRGPTMIYPDDVRDHLESDNNLILFYGNEEETGPETLAEWRTWMNHWWSREKGSRSYIPIDLNRDPRQQFPYPYNAGDVLVFHNYEPEELARRVLSRLVPPPGHEG